MTGGDETFDGGADIQKPVDDESLLAVVVQTAASDYAAR